MKHDHSSTHWSTIDGIELTHVQLEVHNTTQIRSQLCVSELDQLLHPIFSPIALCLSLLAHIM